MFNEGFEKIAKKVEQGLMESVGKSISGAWKDAKPYANSAMHHLQSDRALRGAALGAAGGAVTGATSKDEYGNYKGFDGAVGGAIKGGITGGIAGATWNRYKQGPGPVGKGGGSAPKAGGNSGPKQSAQGKGNKAKKREAEVKATKAVTPAPAKPEVPKKVKQQPAPAAKALGGAKGKTKKSNPEAFQNV